MPTANSQLRTAKSKAHLLQTQQLILKSPAFAKKNAMPRSQRRQEHFTTVSAANYEDVPWLSCSLRFGYAANHCRYKMPPQKRRRVEGQFGLVASLRRNATLKTSCPLFLQCDSSNKKPANIRELWFNRKMTPRGWPMTAKLKRELELRVGWVGRYSL